MMKKVCSTRSLKAIACLAMALAATGCARLQQTPGGSLLAQVDPVLAAAKPGAQLALDVSPREFHTGDTVTMKVHSKTPGYLYVVQLGTDGQDMKLIFPNGMDGVNYTPGGELALPRPNWQFKANGPAGAGYMVAILADKAQDLNLFQASLGRQRIAVDGPYSATMLPVLEIAAK